MGKSEILYTFGNPVSLRLDSQVIVEAIDTFTAGIVKDGVVIGGHPPAAIAIHPWLLDPDKAWPEFRLKYKTLAKELAPTLESLRSRDIAVKGNAGILSWQVAIIADNHQTEDAFYTPNNQAEARPQRGVKRPGGALVQPNHRPRLFGEDVDTLIANLAHEGLGAKKIHQRLISRGMRINLSSVAKRLQVIKKAQASTKASF